MTTDSEDNPLPTETGPTEIAVPTIEDYRRRIQASWQKRTETGVDVAKECHDANERLPAKAKQELWRSALPFGKGTFLKLAKIGGDQRLIPIAAKLPPGFSTIYEIALLSKEQFEHAVAANLIHPKVRRAEIVALRKASEDAGEADDKKAASQPSATENEAVSRYEIVIPEGTGADDRARITQALGKLSKKFKVEVNPTAESRTIPAEVPVSAAPSGSPGSPVNQNPRMKVPQRLNTTTSMSSVAEKRPKPSVNSPS